jgi:hypothetical protein
VRRLSWGRPDVWAAAEARTAGARPQGAAVAADTPLTSGRRRLSPRHGQRCSPLVQARPQHPRQSGAGIWPRREGGPCAAALHRGPRGMGAAGRLGTAISFPRRDASVALRDGPGAVIGAPLVVRVGRGSGTCSGGALRAGRASERSSATEETGNACGVMRATAPWRPGRPPRGSPGREVPHLGVVRRLKGRERLGRATREGDAAAPAGGRRDSGVARASTLDPGAVPEARELGACLRRLPRTRQRGGRARGRGAAGLLPGRPVGGPIAGPCPRRSPVRPPAPVSRRIWRGARSRGGRRRGRRRRESPR